MKNQALLLADEIQLWNNPCARAAAELRRLHQSEHEGWRYANELEQERKRLHEANQAMLEALKRIADPRNTHFAGDAQVVARAAIAKGEQQ